MANINLLPWREELREGKKKEFFTWLFAAALLAGLALFAADRYFASSIEDQQSKNAYMQTEINKLNEKAKLLEELKKERAALIERVRVIQNLQGERPRIVHVFDELVRILPDGIFLSSFKREGEKMTLIGTAETNNYVSNFMRKLSSSQWFLEPNLIEVKANPKFGEQANDFQMTVDLSQPVSAATATIAAEQKNG